MPQLSRFDCCSSVAAHITRECTEPPHVSQRRATEPLHESSVTQSCAGERLVPAPAQQNQHRQEGGKNADPQPALDLLESEPECY